MSGRAPLDCSAADAAAELLRDACVRRWERERRSRGAGMRPRQVEITLSKISLDARGPSAVTVESSCCSSRSLSAVPGEPAGPALPVVAVQPLLEAAQPLEHGPWRAAQARVSAMRATEEAGARAGSGSASVDT